MSKTRRNEGEIDPDKSSAMLENKKLQRWAKEHHIEVRSMQRFWSCFREYQSLNPRALTWIAEDYDASLVEGKIVSASLQVDDWPQGHSIHVVMNIDIYYKHLYYRNRESVKKYYPEDTPHLSSVGEYKLRFTLAGEIDGEYLEIYEPGSGRRKKPGE